MVVGCRLRGYVVLSRNFFKSNEYFVIYHSLSSSLFEWLSPSAPCKKYKIRIVVDFMFWSKKLTIRAKVRRIRIKCDNYCIYNDKFVQSRGVFMKKHYICTSET